jgi:hypothetical protein
MLLLRKFYVFIISYYLKYHDFSIDNTSTFELNAIPNIIFKLFIYVLV